MHKLEHLGFAVKNLSESNRLYTELLGTEPYKQETVSSENVTTSFFKVGDVKVELLEALDDQSPIATFIQNRGEGIHHIAFEVQNIRQEIKRLKKAGFQVIYEEPRKGADNKLVTFIHPKSTHGVLIELCQELN
jgi:methylmalonyl-CoA/ethylmalonyl-CoA epimerase